MPLPTTSARERLQAVELLLLWEGQVRNARLRELFPVHATQASRDIAAYRASAPQNVQRVEGTKDYAPTPHAQPVLSKGEFGEYARLIGATNPNTLRSAVPAERVVAEQVGNVSAAVYRAVHRAISGRHALAIEYTSMSTPDRHLRTIFPHALICAGPRWHVRAYCLMRRDFRDFNLGRISSAVRAEAAPIGVRDTAWEKTIELRLVPHESLDRKQHEIVRTEYMRGTHALVLRRRVALVPYVLHVYRAAVDAKAQRPPDYILQVKDAAKLPSAAHWRP